jgi:hypothetical protein
MSTTLVRTTIAPLPAGEWVLCVAGDVDRDSNDEIIVAGRLPAWGLHLVRRCADGSWRRHLIDDTYSQLEAGGALVDITGDGRLDFVAGGDWKCDLLHWWQCPSDPTQRWVCRTILRMPGMQSHDQLAADIDGDGRPELYFWNQGSRTLFTIPIPSDPFPSPWPGACAIATDVAEEGLLAADIDGDGRPELLAGQSWYRRTANGAWERHVFAEGFVSPRLAAADFDADGKLEIILSEGDASWNGRPFARLARFFRPDDPTARWPFEILHDRLLDPHSLGVADFDGDGTPDLFVGELGDPRGNHPHPPAQRIFHNRGGRLVESIFDTGVGTHEAKVITLDHRPAIVGKPFQCFDENAPRPGEIDAVHLWSA